MRLGARHKGAIDAALRRLAEADGGRLPAFWLRDDDAVAPGAALDRLLAIADEAGMPVSLAVIPALAEPALAERLAGRSDVCVLQHGYAHLDHADGRAKKREFGPDRPVAAMAAEIAEGARRLAPFADVAPIFVPPWNRIDAGLLGALPALGFRAVSAHRYKVPARPGLHAIHTHVDPVDWRGSRGCLDAGAVTGVLVERLGRLVDDAADRAMPTGLLTHHLVHDAQTFAFVEDLLQFLATGGLCRFVSSPIWLAEAMRPKRTVAE